MQPTSLSASAALVYENCPARYHAEYVERTPTVGGDAAGIGTVDHAVLERWVKDGFYKSAPPFKAMQLIFDEEYVKVFADRSRYDDGLAMLKTWHARQDWSGRTVLSTEIKREFLLPTPDGNKLPFRYIWDRADRLDDGSIEVVDYKTLSRPVQPDDLKTKVQPRAYALAAQLEYPDVERVWVTFDMLRYEPVGAVFTKEENKATWRYLKALIKRIWEDDGTTEKLNDECRFCVRKQVCELLTAHTLGGGPLGMADAAAAANRRQQLEFQRAGIVAAINELDEFLLAHMEREDILEFDTGVTHVAATASARRVIDAGRLTEIVGPEIAARLGTPKITAVDALLKGGELSPDQKSQVRQLIQKQFGESRIKTKAITTFEGDEE